LGYFVGNYYDSSLNIHGLLATPTTVPIPGALILVSSGLIGLAGLRRKFRL
jgi:hypothetical protein